MNSSEIKLALKKLNTLGSVLYIAAHPDDENTAALSYFSSGQLFRTGYLSLTRGDGGQNLIGSEQGDLLGLIRTNELLEARKIDGAEQFFTRAIDFGYSKSPEETFTIWDKQKLLFDVVWVIRQFKPDIILTRFPSDGNGGHGHHTASAILAEEAFNLAGDPTKFPEQLRFVDNWQPKRLYWNAWTPLLENRKEDLSKFISVDLGSFNKLLGKSYSEISALARTLHKSQGFGSSGRRGETLNYFSYMLGSKADKSLTDDIDLTWNRVDGSQKVKELLVDAEKNFDEEDPSKSLPVLVEAYKQLYLLPSSYWKEVKLNELKNVIRSCAGIWIECISSDKSGALGDQVDFTAGIVNRSSYPITLKSIKFDFIDSTSVIDKELNTGKYISQNIKTNLPPDLKLSNPYWLQHSHLQGLYEVKDVTLTGVADFRNEIKCQFTLLFNDTEIFYDTPVYFRWTDPVDGEQYSLFNVSPPVSVRLKNKTVIFPNQESKELKFALVSHSNNVSGNAKINLPKDWKIEPISIPFNLKNKNEEKELSFRIYPPKQNSTTALSFEINTSNGFSDREILQLDYKHVLPQTYFPKAEIKLVKVDLEKKINSIGYVIGAGDDIPEYLKQIGYDVSQLTDDDLELSSLNNFDAIVTGIRAYNTREKLSSFNSNLMKYVESGGTLIVQYNNSRELVTDKIGPYPFTISRDRVTEENSIVNFVNPNHQLLNLPNKINKTDFDGWIQERGLYFADKWDSHYETVISCSDNGESEKSGGLLFAKYGKGVFIYTGYAFFRQLPEGVPGAYKLFENIISANQYK
jgi:LmbE family N-acetylglucosaminyl deacetylase